MNIQKSTTNPIHFGTIERTSSINIGVRNIKNNSYFDRPDETSCKNIAQDLFECSEYFDKVEYKIWGCSDLSSYLAKVLAFRKIMGLEEFHKKFQTVTLTDIDSEVIERAKKHLIGLTHSDLHNLKKLFGIQKNDFIKANIPENKFFLSNEEHTVLNADFDKYLVEYDKALSKQAIIPHIFNKDLIKNAKIHTGDIRKDITELKPKDKNTLRILEFTNGWFFLPVNEQIDLAFNMIEKLDVKDMVLLGGAETAGNFLVDEIFLRAGFDNFNNNNNLFVKFINPPKDYLDNFKEYVIKFVKKNNLF